MMGERTVMQEALFYGFSLEDHVPADHLLRSIDRFVDLGDTRDRLDRIDHRKLAPFHGVENRVHPGDANADIFFDNCENDIVLAGEEAVDLADADRREAASSAVVVA